MSANVTQSAASTRAQSQSASSPSLVLQRKCACGGSSGLTGECDECQTKRLLGKPLQAKLRVGAANDDYESEADQVADQVVRMSDATAASRTLLHPAMGLVQRRVRSDGGADHTSVPAIVHEVLSSAGQPLDASTRAFFEPRFGYDFSRVRIHSDTKASQSAGAVNAHAYTVGNQIVTSGTQSLSRHLLAHELTHVVQQGGAGEHLSAATQGPTAQRLQRQPASDTEEAHPTVERSTSTQTFARLERDYPVFAERLTRLSKRFANLVETMQGPLILSGIRDSQSHLQAREEFEYYIDHLRRQEGHMTQGDRYSSRDVHNWLVYIDGALAAVGPLMDLAERGLTDDVTEMTSIGQVRRQLATLSAEVQSLQNVSFIRAEREEIESAAETSRAAAAARAEAAQTPAGRQEAAVAYITKYVDNHWRADLDQASAGVHAIMIGRYLVHDEGFDGPMIQAVLDRLRASNIEVYDRAQFGGRLLVYLLEEGVVGLNVASLLSGTEETEAIHISGAGFYAGFEITWLDLLQREPLTAPNPSVSGPKDFLSLQLGFDKGILWGFGSALNDAFWDVVSTLNPMTYVQLHKLLTEQLSDEHWRFQTGQGLAGSLHKYIQDFADDSAFEIGERFGRGVGFVLAQIFLTWLGAKVATLATSMLRATKFGKPIVEFAEQVADAMPWKEPKIVEGDASPDTASRKPATDPGTDLEARSRSKSGDATLTRRAEIEASVARSEHKETSLLTAEERRNEAAWVDEHPEVVEGIAPRREAPIGESREHRIVEGDGGCTRHSLDEGPTMCPAALTAVDDAAEATAEEKWIEESLGTRSEIRLDEAEAERLMELRREILGADNAIATAQREFSEAKEASTKARQQLIDLQLEHAPHRESLSRHLNIASDPSRATTIKNLIAEMDRAERELRIAARSAKQIAGEKRSDWRAAIQDALVLKEDRFSLSQANHLRNLHSINLERNRLKTRRTELLGRRNAFQRSAKEIEERYLPSGKPVNLTAAQESIKEAIDALPDKPGPINREIEQIEQELKDLSKHETNLHERFLERQAAIEADRLAGRVDRAYYLELRSKTPSDAIRTTFQSKTHDAIYGIEIEGTPEADHIISMFRIVEMRDFQKLAPNNQVKVLNLKSNFWALDKRVNASKGSRSIDEWLGHPDFPQLSPAARALLRQAELVAEEAISKEIARLLRGQKP